MGGGRDSGKDGWGGGFKALLLYTRYVFYTSCCCSTCQRRRAEATKAVCMLQYYSAGLVIEGKRARRVLTWPWPLLATGVRKVSTARNVSCTAWPHLGRQLFFCFVVSGICSLQRFHLSSSSSAVFCCSVPFGCFLFPSLLVLLALLVLLVLVIILVISVSAAPKPEVLWRADAYGTASYGQKIHTVMNNIYKNDALY